MAGDPHKSSYAQARWVQHVDRYSQKVAQRKNSTAAQIALAWVLAQRSWIVPIPGTTKLHRLEENMRATSIELSPEDLRDIESAASGIAVEGARYSEAAERMIDR